MGEGVVGGWEGHLRKTVWLRGGDLLWAQQVFDSAAVTGLTMTGGYVMLMWLNSALNKKAGLQLFLKYTYIFV